MNGFPVGQQYIAIGGAMSVFQPLSEFKDRPSTIDEVAIEAMSYPIDPTPMVKTVEMLCTGYVEQMFHGEKRNKAVTIAMEFINGMPIEERPTGLVSTGLSGNLFSVLLADRLDLDLVIVRKTIDGCNHSHSWRTVEGIYKNKDNRLMIVDDLVSSGETIRNIHKALKACSDEFEDYKQKYGHTDTVSYEFCKTGLMYCRTKGQDKLCEGINFIALNPEENFY